METINKIIEAMKNGLTISEALKVVCGKRHVVLYIEDEYLNIDIAKVVDDPRTSNALKRSGLFTLGNVLDYVEQGNPLSQIKYLGDKGIVCLLEKTLDYSWECMSNEQRGEFLLRIVNTI